MKQIQKNQYSLHDFLQLIKLLNYFKDQAKINNSKPPKVKFLSSVNTKFPRNEIEEIRVTENNQIEITSNFLAIIGSMGVMPSHYTDYILACSREKDTSFLDFINIFYDSLIKSFIKITENNIYLDYERYITSKKSYIPKNWLSINNLIGVSSNIAEENLPPVLLNYTGLLINLSRPVAVLKLILSDYLQFPVEIGQFIREKQKLNNCELSKLGKNNHQLSQSLYLGTNVYFYQNKIAITVSDLDYRSYEHLLTDLVIQKSLHQILNFYLEAHVKYQLIFLVAENEKTTRLFVDKPRKLGVSMWCKG